MARKMTKKIQIGSRFIGGGEPIAVQSMTCTPTTDFEATLAQIRLLEEAGCDIVRFTVPDHDAVRNIARLKENTSIPLVADIHFDYRLAVESAHAGIDKIRINPGNIGEKANVLAVANACREKGIPIRVGVNSGSLALPPKHFAKVPWIRSECWKNVILIKSLYPLSPVTFPI